MATTGDQFTRRVLGGYTVTPHPDMIRRLRRPADRAQAICRLQRDLNRMQGELERLFVEEVTAAYKTGTPMDRIGARFGRSGDYIATLLRKIGHPVRKPGWRQGRPRVGPAVHDDTAA